MASVEVTRMLAAAAAACEDKKAEDIRIFALDPAESGLADFFLICTGTNDRQTVAITDEIELRLKHDFSTYPNSVEGRRQGEWILMDYVDFIVHVFLPEKRAYYGLERLRPSATSLSIDDVNSEIKAAIAANRSGGRATTSKQGGTPMRPVKAAGTATGRKPSAKKSAGRIPAKKAAAPAKLSAKTPGRKTSSKKIAAKKTTGKKASGKRAARPRAARSRSDSGRAS